MASSSSSSHSQKSIDRGFSGIEPPGMRRKVSESTTLYDMFINHRGPDSKQTLALPLYESLEELGIRAFLDKEEMELGQSFPSAIETAMNSALVHIAIISKRYAESPWCLEELILMQQTEAKIIPVFYGVEPWELRHIEKGAYADAFIQYQNKSRYLEKLDEWKEALRSVSFTAGHEIKDLIVSDYKRIVIAVQKEVQRAKPLHVAKYPVALDKLVHDFERRCLDKLVQDFEIQRGRNERKGKAQIVGIFGMGGVGKTTLCKELFNRKRKKYDRACFLFDVREASARNKLPSLQEQLLKDLFGVKEPSFQSREEGSSSIFDHIERSKFLSFLIVLDDINHLDQLEAFMIMDLLKKPGNSLLIISTRDVGVLKRARIEVCYHLKGIDKVDSRVLFSLHAFSQPYPATGYEDLVDAFLRVCGGLPLSLKVLGRHVHNQDLNYWSIALDKYGETLHVDIKKILKISFDALEAEEKQIFIDIACFFVGQSKHTAIRVWKASGWKAEYGLKALQHKCLVEEIGDRVPVLRMHDHLRDLGREMTNELSQPRRLWHPQDLKELESKGFENIFAQTKGRCFHSIFDKSLNFEVQFFIGESDDNAEMSSCLLWLHLLYPYYSRPYSSNLNHPRHPHQLSFSVQPTIPSWIPLQSMQCLRISNGCFKRLWQQDEEAPSRIKQLEICGTLLEEYPDFLGILNHVEKEVKKEVNEVQRKSKMKLLMVKTCKRLSGSLTTFSASKSDSPLNGGRLSATVKVPLSLLEDLLISEQENIERIALNGNYCPNLQSLELYSMTNLIEVQFIGVETLNYLNISKCGYLKILSVTSDLTELEELSISACPMLEEPNLGHLSCLKKIRIADLNMNSVPGMFSFKMLVELNVSRCPNLHELCLAHLSWLEKLIIHHCDDLKSLTGLSRLLKLAEVSISWCWMLQLDLCLVGLNCLKSITADRSVKVKCFELNDCKNLETVSGILFEMIRVVNICGCPELNNFPDICSSNCLELITINGCGKLNHFRLPDCGILKRVSRLYISNCPMLQELPCFGRAIQIEENRILHCASLQNMTLPTTLKRLEIDSCRVLKAISGISGLTKLAELNIKKCPQLRLELNLSSLNPLQRITIVECWNVYNITLPAALIEFKVQRCMKLQIEAGIGHLTKLTELHISECPEIEEMPVVCGLSCLESVTIDGCGKFKYLHVIDCAILKVVRGNFDLGHLTQLWISNCPELEELPCFAHLTCLTEISIFRCRKLQKVTLPRTLKNLQLVSCIQLKSVSEISRLKNLVELVISECGQLELDLHLEHMDSLHRITFDGCGKLKYFLLRKCQNLKRVLGNFDAEWISICGCHELVELSIRDCPGLSLLKKINIESCDKLQNVTLPAKLTYLIVQRCRHLQRIAGLDDLSKLTELDITQCPEIELLFLAELNCLERITINSSEKLHKIILPASVLKISVQWCINLQMVAGIGNLSKLTELYISECPDLEDLPILFGLNSVEIIRIDGCGKLNRLKLADCGISELEGVSCSFDMGNLVQMWISDCPALEELACFARLTCLERISIIRSTKLQKITLPITLKSLHLDSCKELKHVSKMGDLSKLTELCISECPLIEKLPILSGQCCLEKIIVYSCENLHTITLPTTLMKLTVQWCRKLQRVVAMGYLSKLTDLYISECPDLEELPVLFGLSSLEIITIDGCQKLNSLMLADCGISELVSCSFDMGHLAQLWITDCSALEELSCFARLTCLEGISIIRCRKLQKRTLPMTLKNLHLDSCKELKCVSKMDDLSKVTQLYISECPLIEELPILAGHNCLERIIIYSCEKLHKITLPTTFLKFTVQWCRKLQKKAAMGDLTKLTELCISKCPELEQLTVLSCLRNLERITINGCEKLNCLQVVDSSKGMGHLAQLWISDCPKLEELSCFAHLTCLEIHIFRCRKLQKITFPISLNNFQLDSCKELNSVSHKNPVDLIISDYGQLEVELRLEDMDFLQNITFDGCGKMKYFQLNKCQNLKRVSGNFDVERLAICACPKLEELSNLAGLNYLGRINIDSCDKLHIIRLPTTLIQLTVQRCRNLKVIAAIGSLPKLTHMYISECEELEGLPDLAGLSYLIIDSCQKLHNVALPTTPINVTLQRCRNLQMVAGMGDLTRLTELHIIECPKIEEMQVLCGLSCLDSVTLDGCEKFKYLHVIDCALLKLVRGNFDLVNLAQLWISDCPELEELPCFANLTCLKEIIILRCRKLQKVTLPKTLNNLQLVSCKKLKSVSEISCLKNLVELIISECGQLEVYIHLKHMDSRERITFDCYGKIIVIGSCEKLQSILLPTITLINLKVRRCRELKNLAGIDNLTKSTGMFIGDCPEFEELPNLSEVSCLESINIDSCERMHNITLSTALIKLGLQGCGEFSIPGRLSCLQSIIIMSFERLENIQGIEELQSLEIFQFPYCSKEATRECILKLEHVSSTFIQVAGRAANGAKSNLNPCMLSEAYFYKPGIYRSPGDIIIFCGISVSNSSPVHIINESFKDSTWKFYLPQGESIITTIVGPKITRQNYERLYRQYEMLSNCCVWSVKKGEEWRIWIALTTIIDKLHQK